MEGAQWGLECHAEEGGPLVKDHRMRMTAVFERGQVTEEGVGGGREKTECKGH